MSLFMIVYHSVMSCCHAVMSCCHMSSAYVDHLDMLNNFCFHVYAQKPLFMIVCHAVMMSYDICHMSKGIMLILGTCSTSFVFMSRLNKENMVFTMIRLKKVFCKS